MYYHTSKKNLRYFRSYQYVLYFSYKPFHNCWIFILRLILASQTAMSLKDVAQLVVGLGSGIEKNKVTKDEMKNEGRFGTNPEWTNKIY